MLPGFFTNVRSIGYRWSWVGMLLALQGVTILLEGISIGAILPVLQVIETGGDIEPLRQNSALWKHLIVVTEALNVSLSLPTLLVGIFVLILIRQVFIYIREVYSAGVQLEVIRRVRDRAFKGFLYAHLDHHDNIQAGRFVNELTTELLNAAASISTGIKFIGHIMTCVAYGVIVFILSPFMTVVAFTVLAVVAVLLVRVMRGIYSLGYLVTGANQEMSSFLVERLKAIRLVRLSNIEAAELNALRGHTERQRLRLFEQRKLLALLGVLIEPIVLAIAFVLLYVAVSKLALEMAAIMLFFFILLRMAPIVKEAIIHRQSYLAQVAAIEVVLERLRSLEEAKDDPGGDRELTVLEEGIVCRDVHFNYTGSQAKALNGLNLVIPAAKMTAIVGPSGAGKSTLVDCLPRLRTLVSGQILFDHVAQSEFSVVSLRQAISFVSQSPQIFNVSAAEHIRYGRPSATDEEVRWAAAAAQADDFISGLSEGFETLMGEEGIRLSGGQRQRLDLARALIRRAPILVLDEPTSNLDPESEAKFLAALEAVRRDTPTTLIVIAHKLSTVRLADQIAVMEDGGVTASGTFTEVSEKNSWFCRAYGAPANAAMAVETT
jgi:ABC-type multidrug transport system fused ATPase/permease subunit